MAPNNTNAAEDTPGAAETQIEIMIDEERFQDKSAGPIQRLVHQNSEESQTGTPPDDFIIPLETPTLDASGKVTRSFVENLIEFYRQEKRLPTLTIHKILKDAKELFQSEPSLVDIELGRDDVVNICGDIHGQFFDLANIFEIFGKVSEQNRYLFNGDFVDRGVWSLEVVMVLFSLKLLNPKSIYLTRGNHECEQVNHLYGFENEVLDKYDSRTFRLIQKAFNWLPIAHCVNGSVLVMHGGLPAKEGVTLDDIRDIKRGKQPERNSIMIDLLWADPQVKI